MKWSRVSNWWLRVCLWQVERVLTFTIGKGLDTFDGAMASTPALMTTEQALSMVQEKLLMVDALRVYYKQELQALVAQGRVPRWKAQTVFAFDERFHAVPWGCLSHAGMDVLSYVPLAHDPIHHQHVKFLISYNSPLERAVSLYMLTGRSTPVASAVRMVCVPTEALCGPGTTPKTVNLLPIVHCLIKVVTSVTCTAE